MIAPNRHSFYDLLNPFGQGLPTSWPEEEFYNFRTTQSDQIMIHVKEVLKKRTFAEELKAFTLEALLPPLGKIEPKDDISPLKSQRVDEKWATKSQSRFTFALRSSRSSN
jgi:hypothetical protein